MADHRERFLYLTHGARVFVTNCSRAPGRIIAIDEKAGKVTVRLDDGDAVIVDAVFVELAPE